jgi:hypothetical protein
MAFNDTQQPIFEDNRGLRIIWESFYASNCALYGSDKEHLSVDKPEKVKLTNEEWVDLQKYRKIILITEDMFYEFTKRNLIQEAKDRLLKDLPHNKKKELFNELNEKRTLTIEEAKLRDNLKNDLTLQSGESSPQPSTDPAPF